MPTPAYLGEIGTAYSAAAATTLTITTTAAVPAGSALFVTVRAGSGIFVSSVTDSASNAYSLVGRFTTGNTASMFAVVVPVALASGATVTITTSGSVASIQANAFAFTNLTLTGTAVASQTASGTTSTSGSVTPAQYSGVVISLVTLNAPIATPTLTTANGLTATSFSGTQMQAMAYRVTTDRAARSVVWTESGSSHIWAQVIVALNAVNADFLALF